MCSGEEFIDEGAEYDAVEHHEQSREEIMSEVRDIRNGNLSGMPNKQKRSMTNSIFRDDFQKKAIKLDQNHRVISRLDARVDFHNQDEEKRRMRQDPHAECRERIEVLGENKIFLACYFMQAVSTVRVLVCCIFLLNRVVRHDIMPHHHY